VVEAAPSIDHNDILGTAQYTAPEYFLGESGSSRSDIFSLGVITYQMLTGRLPYGAQIAKARTRSEQRKLRYASALDDTREIPAWIDAVLKKAVHPDPRQRYDELSEFAFDLRHPNKTLLGTSSAPLIERNPLLFWQALSLLLLLAILGLLFLHFGGRS
jgi:serine/threonine protein kinase